MLRIAALSFVFAVALASSARAQNPSHRELEAANLRQVVHSVALRAKPGRSPRRSLSRTELRAFADHVRAIHDGTPVIGVHLYQSGSYAAGVAASQAMASDIVRRLEALGVPRGRVLPFGFGANRRIAAMNRARARHTHSHVDLFVVPAASTTAPVSVVAAPPNAPAALPSLPPAPRAPPVQQPRSMPRAGIVERVTALTNRARGSLLACTPTNRDLALTLMFDEQGRVAGIAGPFSASEARCFRRALANERIAPPGSRISIGVRLRPPASAPSPVRSRSAPDILKGRD